MSTIDLLTTGGDKGGTVDLPGDLFDVTTNIPLIHQVVNAQLAAARQGTHATKTRGLVRGGGVKPWRQKGTGRARQGSRRAPQWVGGGTVHGPQPRSYAQKTPKRMIQAALLGVLSDRARDGRVVVLESIVTGETPSTKQAVAALKPVAEYRNVLLVLDRDDFVGWLSVRNLPEVHVVNADQLGAYDVVISDVVVFTRTAIEVFAAAKGSAVKVSGGDKPARKTSAKKTADETEAAEAAVEAVAEKAASKPAAAKKVAAQADDAAAEAKTAVKKAAGTAAKKAATAKPAAKKVAGTAEDKAAEAKTVVKKATTAAKATAAKPAAAAKAAAAAKPAAKKPAAKKEETK